MLVYQKPELSNCGAVSLNFRYVNNFVCGNPCGWVLKRVRLTFIESKLLRFDRVADKAEHSFRAATTSGRTGLAHQSLGRPLVPRGVIASSQVLLYVYSLLLVLSMYNLRGHYWQAGALSK